MKKILLFLSFLLMSIGMWGADVEFTPSSSGGMSSTAGRISGTKNGITIVISNGVNNGTDIRVYKNASMTITSSVGNITNIAFTYSGSNNGGWSSNYTPNSTSWTSPTASGTQARCTRIVVTYTPSAATYSVTYKLNGGTGTTPTETNKEKDATFGLHNGTTGITPPSCKTFSKWKDQDNNEFNGGATYTMPAKNVTLTAQWVDVPLYTVSFSTGAEEQTQTSCGTAVSLPTPTVSSACSALGWSFAGWSESNSDYSSLKKDTYIPTSNITLYAVYKKSDSDATGYILVEEDLDDWSGDYLIAYSSSIFADGRVGGTSGIGAQYTSVDPSTNLSGKVVDDDWGDQYNVTLEAIEGGYVMKTKDGKYNYQTSNTNGLASTENLSTASAYPLSVTFNSSSDIDISISAGAIFHYNTDGYFRFYKNGSQNNIYLYKKQGGYEYSFNPTCETVNVDTVTLPVDTIRIHVGETYELTPTVLPSNATNKNVLWMSTMPSIATVENGVVTGVAEGFAAAIVATEDGNKSAACVVIVLGNANIDVVEWNPDWLKIDIENFTAVTAVLEDQNTQADVKQKFANDLFFSKYFEAGGSNKMLGFYNGTKDTLNLKKYTFKTARVSAAAINLGNYGNYQDTLMLPNTEILFVHYDETNSAKDTSFNSVNIHRNSIMTGGRVYTPSTMYGGTVYYSTGSSGTRPGGPIRSPQRPYSGNFLEDLADWWRMTTDSNWPGYVDEDYWEEFLTAYPEYKDEARAWFESQGKHFPGDPDDPFADPLEDDLLVLSIIAGIYFISKYIKRKTVSV